jgi:ADP-ribose pyrophosphatase
MYRRTTSEYRFRGKVFNVRIDQVQSPSGDQMRVDLVEHEGSIAVVPVDDDQEIWLVRQYRHAAGEDLLELPAGTLEPGENPEACALRESQEEIGMAPRQLQHLGSCFLAPGYSTERMDFFLATDLQPSRLPQDQDEHIRVERMPLALAFQRLIGGEFRDAKTIAGIALALGHLGMLRSPSPLSTIK